MWAASVASTMWIAANAHIMTSDSGPTPGRIRNLPACHALPSGMAVATAEPMVIAAQAAYPHTSLICATTWFHAVLAGAGWAAASGARELASVSSTGARASLGLTTI